MATPRVVGPVIGVLFLLGGAAVLATVLLPSDPAGEPWPLTAAAAVASAAGAVLVRWGSRLPRSVLHASVLLGTGLIGVVVLAAGDARTATALAGLSSFVAVGAFFLFPPLHALAHLGTAMVANAAVLAARGLTAGPLLAHSLVIATIGLVVALLVRMASGASVDGLTGLANRRGFDDALDAAVRAAARGGPAFSVALVDVDHFKTVNDRLGHAAGDDLLRALAGRWAPDLPHGAVLARHGGDEFALLLPACSGDEALATAERLRRTAPAGVSAGVAQHRPGEPASQVVRRADAALYRVKAAGRGACALDDDASGRLADDLAAALAAADPQADEDGTGLTVHYQPVIRLPDGVPLGFEALVRWQHPGLGAVPPDRFVPVAEREGLIAALGAFVVARAARDMAALRARTGVALHVGFNASGAELGPGYAGRVLAALDRAGWPATATVVEVTESVAAADAPAARQALADLRAAGVVVAIDDFGTGWSALSRLDTMPADVIKLDRSFVSSVTSSPRRARLVAGVVEMAGALGLAVVAEGVETEEEAAAVTALGCTSGQGWLYGRPGPAHRLDALVRPATAAGRAAG